MRSETRLLTLGSAAALGGILVLAAVFRLILMMHAPAFTNGMDSAHFYTAADTLLHSGDYPAIRRAPLYPIFLSGVIGTLGPRLETIAVVQHAIGLATIILVYVIGALVFGRGAALLAALGAALNGALLVMEHSIISEALLTPLLLAGLLLLLLACRTNRKALFLAAGLFLGACALTRPAAQALLPVVLLVVLARPGHWHGRLTRAGALTLGFALLVTPWMVRNRLVHGDATISSGLGEALFQRTRFHDDFAFVDRAQPLENRRAARVRQRVFELARNHKFADEVGAVLREDLELSEAEIDAALRQAALQVISQEPLHFAQSTLAMFGRLAQGYDKPLAQLWEMRVKSKWAQGWPPSAGVIIPESSWGDSDRIIADALTDIYQDHNSGPLIIILFLVGAIRCLRGPRSLGMASLPLIAIAYILLHVALDGPIIRYRYPVQPIITLIAAWGGLAVLAEVRAYLTGGRSAPVLAAVRRWRLLASSSPERG